MINEDLNFNNIKDSTIDVAHKLSWMNGIIPLIGKELLWPIPNAEVIDVRFIDNFNVEVSLKSNHIEYLNCFNNPLFTYKFCIRFLSMTRSKIPEYSLEYYWPDGPTRSGVFFADLRIIDYFTNNDSHMIKIDKITNLYEFRMIFAGSLVYKISTTFSDNLEKIMGHATLFTDFRTLNLIHNKSESIEAFSKLYDLFDRVHSSERFSLYPVENMFYLDGCYVKRKDEINESVDFKNVSTDDTLNTLFKQMIDKKIVCEEFPKFLSDVKIQLNKELTNERPEKVVFDEIDGYKRLFFICIEENGWNDGKVHVKLYVKDESSTSKYFFGKFEITKSIVEYIIDDNSNLVFDEITSRSQIIKIYDFVIDEKIEQNKNLRDFLAGVIDLECELDNIKFDCCKTAVNFIQHYTELGLDFIVDLQLSFVGFDHDLRWLGREKDYSENLLSYPEVLKRSHVTGGSTHKYRIWVNNDYWTQEKQNNNKYKNMMITEMVNDTPYYIGNTEQMNNALAQANKDEELYAKNNFARHEFIRAVLGNKLYNDILDLGATGTFAPIPLNLVRLTHDDFRKFLKTNGLLDTDDVIIKIYNIIRQSYIRYLFREVNDKIDTDIVFKTFDEVIDFFYVIYHALEKIFLKRVISDLELKWKPITNRFKEYLA